MTLVPAELVIAARRSAGNLTARNGHSGPIFYTKVTPADPNSIRQQGVRNGWRLRSKDWRDMMSEAQRQGWRTYAANTPVGRTLSGPKYITGMAMYMRQAILKQRAAIPTSLIPPTTFGIPATGKFDYKIFDGSNVLGITWDNWLPWGQELGSWAFISATVCYSRFINSYKPPYAFVGTVPGSAMPPVTRNLPYLAAGGGHIFLRAVIVRADNRVSSAHRIPTTVRFP